MLRAALRVGVRAFSTDVQDFVMSRSVAGQVVPCNSWNAEEKEFIHTLAAINLHTHTCDPPEISRASDLLRTALEAGEFWACGPQEALRVLFSYKHWQVAKFVDAEGTTQFASYEEPYFCAATEAFQTEEIFCEEHTGEELLEHVLKYPDLESLNLQNVAFPIQTDGIRGFLARLCTQIRNRNILLGAPSLEDVDHVLLDVLRSEGPFVVVGRKRKEDTEFFWQTVNNHLAVFVHFDVAAYTMDRYPAEEVLILNLSGPDIRTFGEMFKFRKGCLFYNGEGDSFQGVPCDLERWARLEMLEKIKKD
jgi:hypothetical protein